MYKISQEDYAELYSILSHPGYKILIKEMSNLVESQAQTLLKTRLSDESERNIFALKARHEGAEKLMLDLDARMQKLFRVPVKEAKKSSGDVIRR